MQRSFEVIAGTEPARAPGFTPVISSMDVPRPHIARQKRKRRLIIAAASVLGIILITVVVSRLKPAAMSVDRAAVWVDTVKRGPMLAPGAWPRHARAGRHSLDRRGQGRPGGKDRR